MFRLRREDVMRTRYLFRALCGAAAVIGSSACASASPNVFERHDAVQVQRQIEEATKDRQICPVIVSNATGHLVDAVYRQEGRESMLGRIPSGRSLTFSVHCDSGPVEAVAISDFGGFLGGGQKYRKMAAVDRAGDTELSLTVTDRIR